MEEMILNHNLPERRGVYLMDCLAIHHNSFTKKFKTIPEAQRYYTEKILMELPKPKGKVRRKLIILSLIILCCMGCNRKNYLDTGTIPSPTELERRNLMPAPYASDNTNPFKKDWEKLCKNYPYKSGDIITQDLYDTLRKLNLIYEGNYSPSADYINTYCRSYLDDKNNVKGRLR